MEVKMINNRPVKIWIDNVEESVMRQIENLTKQLLPCRHSMLTINDIVYC